LGDFYISGYTRQTVDAQGNLVFLKNVGDEIALSFTLRQDIDNLNANERLILSEDANGFDAYFQTEKSNIGRGMLVIRKTDYQNNATLIGTYDNYLAGVTQGADTSVQVFEEGDYEVALNYEIGQSRVDVLGWEPIHTYTNYRIFFKFSVRNSNCMVYPLNYPATDVPVELRNLSATETGFSLDLAKSRYLTIQVKREMLMPGTNGYVKDLRYNRAAVDGENYTEPGIYTIEVSNAYTNQHNEMTLFVVGGDPAIKAYIDAGYSLDEFNQRLKNGYPLDEEGGIASAFNLSLSAPADTSQASGGNEAFPSASTQNDNSAQTPYLTIILVVLGVMCVMVVGFVYYKRSGKKK
jgi:hypothetical protein